MRAIHLNSNDPAAKAIANAAFPKYNGRKFKVVITSGTFNLSSDWEGGSGSHYAIIRLADMKAANISQASFVGDGYSRIGSDFTIKEGFAIVEHAHFMGHDSGITIYILEANATKLIPDKLELTPNEITVLKATQSFKSSYGGNSHYRQTESGLPMAIWTATVEILKGKHLLRANGAITPEGRNAINF